jgi:hypothetical protein
MWILKNKTLPRPLTWQGGTLLEPYTDNSTDYLEVSGAYTIAYLTKIKFTPTYPIPGLIGFSIEGDFTNTSALQLSSDLVSCRYINDTLQSGKAAIAKFYFSDLTSNLDLAWMSSLPGTIYLDTEFTKPYNPSLISSLPIDSSSTVLYITNVNLFLPFLGIYPTIEQSKVYVVQSTERVNAVKFYGSTYSVRDNTLLRVNNLYYLIG